MKIGYPHNLTNEEAYNKINDLILDLRIKYSDEISNEKKSWNEEHTQMDYSMKIMGIKIKGKVHLSDSKITLEGKLPFVAIPFSKKIENRIRKQLEESFS